MKRLLIKAFREAAEPLEIYWLAGLERAEGGDWRVRVVTRGMETQRMKMWKLPIGMLSLLSLGIRLDDRGVMLETQSRGQVHTATLSNLAGGVEVTSADMPRGLHPFVGGQPGVQKLIRYKTQAGEVLLPTIELVRYLLAHNKTLANALMVPGQLMTLYQFEPIGIYDELTLRFTSEMPLPSLSRDFALEFAWLAIHPEGRKTWDSVYRKTVGKDYVSLDPPDVPDATIAFRGIEQNGVWLVLEILYLSGREPPCESLRYWHPGFRKANGSVVLCKAVGGGGDGNKKGGDDVDVVVSDEGSRIATSQLAVDVGAKCSEFKTFVPTEKVWTKLETPQRYFQQDPTLDGGDVGDGKGGGEAVVCAMKRRIQVKGSACRESRGASVPPLEFRTLESYSWEFAGELQALADTITIMAGRLNNVEISMSLCRLKPGRAFSSVGRRPRCCLVIHINVANEPPIVLLDVDRAGEWALSTMALEFLKPVVFSEIEMYVKTVLDRLVDNGGHWDPLVGGELKDACTCTRLPKVLPKRGSNCEKEYQTAWALRLALKLGLPLKQMIH